MDFLTAMLVLLWLINDKSVLGMARLFDFQQFKLINKYALRDFSRSYKKLWVVTSTLFVSLLLLSLTFSIKEALNIEIENNSKELLGGDIQVDSDIEPLPNQVIEKFNELVEITHSFIAF